MGEGLGWPVVTSVVPWTTTGPGGRTEGREREKVHNKTVQ